MYTLFIIFPLFLIHSETKQKRIAEPRKIIPIQQSVVFVISFLLILLPIGDGRHTRVTGELF